MEGCQAADETSGIWKCAFKKVDGEVVLEVAVLECSSVAGPLGGVAPLPSSYESSGSMLATSARCLSSGEFVSKAQRAGSSGSQMLCSDTLRQSGAACMSLSCGGAFISDTCMVFCAEGYQAFRTRPQP